MKKRRSGFFSLTLLFLAVNLLVALASWALQTLGCFDFIRAWLPLYESGLGAGRIWQFFTYMWVHAPLQGPWALHLVFNMVALASFGVHVERKIGSAKFALLYLGGGLAAAAFAVGEMKIRQAFGGGGAYGLEGASGAILAVVAAFAWIYGKARLLVFPIPVPVAARKMLYFFIGVSVLLLLAWPESFISNSAHLGGILWGLLFVWYLKRKEEVKGPEGGEDLPQEEGEDPLENWSEERLRMEGDRVLAKLHQSGKESLSNEELEILERLSEIEDERDGRLG